MESAICFSQYFVDKQNVRSFSNIIRKKNLKKDKSYIHHIFTDEEIVRILSDDITKALINMKTNLLSNIKHDFREYFPIDEYANKVDLVCVNKEDVFKGCCQAIKHIIPKDFFGNSHNEKLFHNLIHTIVFSMKRQHIILGRYLKKWDITASIWKTVSDKYSRNILFYSVLWICQYIVSSIICLNFYVTTCKLDSDEYKLYFFMKSQWQSFYDKKISNMLLNNVINRFECNCMGKKIKRNYSFTRKTKVKMLNKDIPKLHLVLKANNDCRPIVRYKNNCTSLAEKYKIKGRLSFLKFLTGEIRGKIEDQYATVYKKWVELNRPKLYFVKADLSNAFGSIDRSELMKVLHIRYMKYLETQKCERQKEKISQKYKDLISDLRKPILVRAGSTVFVWKRGLVQGYKYSPALSELYYTYMDEIFFTNYFKNIEGPRLFTRVVDDYLYITESLEDARSFLGALSNYKNVNYEKTLVNFAHENIKYSDQITFLGYTYNTSTLHVSRGSSVFVGQMCYKIAFSQAITNLYKFMEQRIGQSSIQINGHLFNLHRNSEEIVWTHIFTTLCNSANKFCTILAILCDVKEMGSYLSVYKKRVTVKLCNNIIETLIKNKPADIKFMYCINHFRYLSWKALLLCAQQTSKCNVLVPHINDELNKSNCIFGKWKEHASRIDSNGVILRPAVKEICRRRDWRSIMKKFVSLPDGFQCYNHKNFMGLSKGCKISEMVKETK